MSTPVIIVLAVLGFVVGSIFWILPSPAERRRMKLRQVAYNRGFRVKKQTLNDLHSSLSKETEESTYYYFSLGKFPGVGGRQVWVSEQGAWRCAGEASQGEKDLSWFSDEVEGLCAVLMSSSEIGFLWTERGTPEKVNEALDKLTKMAEG
ncbi:hypothetical protein [Hahella ganghwensis]|uniref:hypothetical protein n=1 Tax=Hahella ganghwensis TaxID=286420 RepID=UPI00035DC458|nr:hypothetical protein [Hahella ganghwensis]